MLDTAREAFQCTSRQASREALLGKLTTRESQVLERIVAGRLNKQIADDLGISIKTVEAHRANIMEKLNANTVADLLKIALALPRPDPLRRGHPKPDALCLPMTAQLIDGNALSRQLRTDVAQRVAPAQGRRGITPGLAVILVGDNPASQVYVRNKVKACEDTGMHSVLESTTASLTEAELLARVAALNATRPSTAFWCSCRCRPHIDAHKVIEAISPAKDVDGFHVAERRCADDRPARLLAHARPMAA
jgi:DNA-binding CsgD family transcriptional regulator